MKIFLISLLVFIIVCVLIVAFTCFIVAGRADRHTEKELLRQTEKN